MSELAQRILHALSSRNVGDIVTDDEIRQLAGNPELIEFSAAMYELKEAGYLKMIIGLKWQILRKAEETMLKGFKTCQDFETEEKWDTSLCCAWCHGDYEHSDDHEMHSERHQGQSVWVCKPLYEQLFQGASHFEETAQ